MTGRLALAAFLTLAPVTMLVPGLAELVRDAHGGTRFDAHVFMAINMLTGMAAVPVVRARLPRFRKRSAGISVTTTAVK